MAQANKSIPKTNVARVLDSKKVKYELTNYTVNEEDLSTSNIANQLNINHSQIFKTLVLRGDKNGLFVCVVPGDCEIDLKKAAKVSGNKKAEMILMKELLPLTGYIRGGCSPIGMKKSFPTFFHQTCQEFPFILVSAGVRGTQIKVAANDLIEIVRAQVADLV